MIGSKNGTAFRPEVAEAIEDAKRETIRIVGLADAVATAFPYYLSADDSPTAVVVRVDGTKDDERTKEIRPWRWTGTSFELGAPEVRPPFRHERLPEGAERVMVVEGEKCVMAVEWLREAAGEALGERVAPFAITSMGGSSAALLAEWGLLPKGITEVVFLPDNDEPGEKYARDVEDQLLGLDRGIEVGVVRLPGLAETEDICNWVVRSIEAYAARKRTTVKDVKRDPGLRTEFALEVIDELEELIAAVDPEVEEEWSEPLPLVLTPPHVALNFAEAFPAPLARLREYVEGISEELQVHPDACALMVITAISSTLAKKAEVLAYPPRTTEKPPLWTYIQMDPGERKTSLLREVQAPMTEYSRKWVLAHGDEVRKNQQKLRLLEKRVEALENRAATAKKPEERDEAEKDLPGANTKLKEFRTSARGMLSFPVLSLQDATAEGLEIALAQNDDRMFMTSTEGGVIEATLGRYNKGSAPNLDVWLKGYDGEEHNTCRVSREGADIKPLIAVLICSNEDVLETMMATPSAAKRGFVPRFSKIIPLSSVGYRSITPAPCADGARRDFHEAMQRLLKLPIPLPPEEKGPGPVVCTLGAEAMDLFNSYREKVEVQLRPGHELEDCVQWGSKHPGRVARIALSLHAMSEWGYEDKTPKSASIISGEFKRAALAWVPFLIAGEKRAAAEARPTPTAKVAQRVLSWIRKKGLSEFSHREAYTARRCTDAPASKDFDPILELLVDTGYIRRLPSKKEGRSGRDASPRYEVNPNWMGGDDRCETAQNAQNSVPPTPAGNSARSARPVAGADDGAHPTKIDQGAPRDRGAFADGGGLVA